MTENIDDISEAGFSIKGAVTFDNVMRLRKEGGALIAASERSDQDFCIELSQADKCDSIVLPLLLSWIKAGKEHKIKLKFTSLPTSLVRMIKLFGLQDIIPTDSND